METKNDRVAKKDYFDLLDISADVGEEEDNQLFQWVRPIHLDDEVGNLDPRIAARSPNPLFASRKSTSYVFNI